MPGTGIADKLAKARAVEEATQKMPVLPSNGLFQPFAIAFVWNMALAAKIDRRASTTATAVAQHREVSKIQDVHRPITYACNIQP